MSELLHNLIGTLQAAEKAQAQVRLIRNAVEKLDAAYYASEEGFVAGVPRQASEEQIGAGRLEFIQSVRAILKGGI